MNESSLREDLEFTEGQVFASSGSIPSSPASGKLPPSFLLGSTCHSLNSSFVLAKNTLRAQGVSTLFVAAMAKTNRKSKVLLF
jgi:hypothetical protein